ncbi:MAG: hypothetical protein HYW03_01685 [Deltaproteobacteria bacterium]|nr:hypothetical protein [Deltaproteobacteria bacterium]
MTKTESEAGIPVVFSPDNEPYLGRQALLTFDQEIPFSLWVSSHIAAYARANRNHLTDLQRVACQIVPQGINLALSIRELIRQGYLFAALVLIRPLIERAAIISYVCDHPDAIEKWKDGWRFRDRPPLSTMLHSMARGAAEFEVAKDICEHYGHIVHGDPVAADWNRVPLDDGSLGYAVGKVLNHYVLCDELALQGWAYLRILVARATSCFPEVKAPGQGQAH